MSSTDSAAVAQLRYELLCLRLEVQATDIAKLERRVRDLEDRLKAPPVPSGFKFDPKPCNKLFEPPLETPFAFKPAPAPVFGFPLQGSHSFGSLASTEPATITPIPAPQGFNMFGNTPVTESSTGASFGNS